MKNKATFTKIICSILLLGISAGLLWSAANVAGFADYYAHTIYPQLVSVFGRFSSHFSFSLSELLLYCLILFLVPQLFAIFRHPIRILSRIILIASVLAFLYTIGCGINYRAGAFSEYAGLQVEKHSEEELIQLCEYLTDMVNKTVPALPENHDTIARKNENGMAAMKKLGEEYDIMAGFYPNPKPLMISYILSVQQLCGVYSPFTIEANYNREMPDYNIPHTICHELSHLKGFMREDEANFIGFLACIGSESPEYQYSGYLTAWVYASNKLHASDKETYFALRERLCARANNDLDENSAFWNQYEGKPAEIQEKMNDAYLKTNGQIDGVKSYGRFVDLLLEYYK